MATLSFPYPTSGAIQPIDPHSLGDDMINAANGFENTPLIRTWKKVTQVDVVINSTYVDDPGTGGGSGVTTFSGSTTHYFDATGTDNATLGYFHGLSSPWIGTGARFEFNVIGTGSTVFTPDSGGAPSTTVLTECAGSVQRINATSAFYDAVTSCYKAVTTLGPYGQGPSWEFVWQDLDENGGTLTYTSSGTTAGGGSWNESVTITITT